MEEQVDDPGAKAPHGDSSDEEDDEVLGVRLRSASQVATGSREPLRQPGEVRSDKATCDEDERRSSVPSTRTVRKEKQRAEKAGEVRSEKCEEPTKRKHKSKHGSKKAAKRATKSHRSQDPDRKGRMGTGDWK